MQSDDICSSTINSSLPGESWIEESNRRSTVIAGIDIPAGVSSLPFVSCLNLRRNNQQITTKSAFKIFLSDCDFLVCESNIDWLNLVRIADNIFEQNVVALQSHNGKAIILRVVRKITAGEELKLWPSIELQSKLEIPFLMPENIVNNRLYRCHRCCSTFQQPNPLKLHLTFECNKWQLESCDFSSIEMKSDSEITSSQTPNSVSPVASEPSSARQTRPAITKEPRTHVCMFCGKLYTRKYGLKIHLRTHTGDKPLQCRFCGRPFSDPSNLNKHIRLHSQHSSELVKSPYKCKKCPKILVRRRDLERHIKSRHR